MSAKKIEVHTQINNIHIMKDKSGKKILLDHKDEASIVFKFKKEKLGANGSFMHADFLRMTDIQNRVISSCGKE